MTRLALFTVSGICCLALLSLASGCGSRGCGSEREPAGKQGEPNVRGKPEGPAGTADEDHGLTPEMAARALVKLGDTVITVGQFAEKIASQSPFLRARYQKPESRRELLDSTVKFELMAVEAGRLGLDGTPEIEEMRKQKMVQLMMSQLFERDGVLISEITDDEIRVYYDQHRNEYRKPEQVRVSHIQLKDRTGAQRLLDELRARPNDRNLFRDLALKHNQDQATSRRFGDFGFVSRAGEELADEPKVPEAVRRAAWAIEQPGGVYPELIEDRNGYHIVAVTDRRRAVDPGLEEVRQSIQSQLWRARREEAIEKFVKELKAKARVVEHPELLERMKVDYQKDPKLEPPTGPAL